MLALDIKLAMTFDDQESIDREVEAALNDQDQLLVRIAKIKKLIDSRNRSQLNDLNSKANRSPFPALLASNLEYLTFDTLAKSNVIQSTVAAATESFVLLDSHNMKAKQNGIARTSNGEPEHKHMKQKS